jgi:uncharacterized protein YkwD
MDYRTINSILKFPAILVSLVAVLVLTQAQNFQAPPPPAGRVMILPAVEAEVFRLTNEIRLRYGFAPLAKDETLSAMARAYCADMLQRRFFSHFNPEGLAPKDRVIPSYPHPIYRLGENIWKGFNEDLSNSESLARLMVNTWMASPGHRDNIFCPDFTHLGVGVAVLGRDLRAEQLFVKLPYK